MTGSGTDALEQALALHATPDRLSLLRERELPAAVMQLIRIVAGDRDALASATQRTAEIPRRIVDAALFYIEHVLFDNDADSYRVLGVRADATDEAIKEHYRWLTRWLHPDRNPERWEVVYAERVNRAWNTLNSEQHRCDYDLRRMPRQGAAGVAMLKYQRVGSLRTVEPSLPHLSPQAISKLPAYVLGGLAVSALLTLALWYFVQRDRQEDVAVAANRLDAAPQDDNTSAQEAAFRQRIAFDEHVAELSQPIEPRSMPRVAPPPALPALAPLKIDDPDAVAINEHSIDRFPDRTAQAAYVSEPPVSMPPRSLRTVASAAKNAPSAAPPPQSPANASRALPSPAPFAARANPVMAQRDIPAPAPPKPATDKPAVGMTINQTLIAQEAAVDLSHAFATAYAGGNLSRMMRLFGPDAVDNRGGIQTITEDYDHLFQGTSSRELDLNEVQWMVRSDRIVGSGPFHARIRKNGELSATRVDGWILIEAAPMNGDWKIQRILHRNAQ